MKKKIELQIPANINIKGKEKLVERRALGIASAIAKRAKLAMPDEKKVKKVKKDGKGKSYVELDLTQKQIDGLPVGLKKMLK